MKELTVAFDTTLDIETETWIKEGTVVKVSDNPFHIKKHKDSTPVIIIEAYDYKSNKIEINPTVEWFMNCSFKELN